MLAIALVMEDEPSVRARWRMTAGPRPRAAGWTGRACGEEDRKTVQWTVFWANARIGQQGTLTRIRAPRGSRPHAPRDTSACIFGAVCPARGTTAALVMPHADTAAMNAHLAEISRM